MASTNGRQAGSLNKDRGRVLRAIRNYAGPEFDPAVKLIELAMNAEAGIKDPDNPDNDVKPDLALASQNYGRLMEYCYPKLRSIEVDGNLTTRELSPEEWLEYMADKKDAAS